MANIIEPRLRPIKSKFRDISLNLTKNPLTNDLNTLSTNQSIAQSVKHLVRIAFYEKWFRPDIGNYSAAMLFELFIPEYHSATKRSIFNVIQKYEPRVELTNGIDDIIISGDESVDRNELVITIRYNIIGKNAEDSVDVYVQRVK